MARVLLVEDDKDLAQVIDELMKSENHILKTVHDGDEGSKVIAEDSFDLMILDWNLPGKTGLELCAEFRKAGGKTPVLMMTGKGEVNDKELGLDTGADDYVTKPFEMRELAARVRALLRRRVIESKSTVISSGNVSIDPTRHKAFVGGEEVKLLPKEFALLEFFMRHPSHVFSSEALMNQVWKSEADASDQVVRQCLMRLRKKVDRDGDLIKTVHGVGYKWEP
ncbi:MAG: response regulator transcription factor [Candidatus Obscuribacterales bacterium]|jgi:DNA-binding response OmpR family regulator|nr:response regulator transcription factor [Candidatus Obscuribacterales bacterium]